MHLHCRYGVLPLHGSNSSMVLNPEVMAQTGSMVPKLEAMAKTGSMVIKPEVMVNI
jgi:hypothetical protein